MHMRLSCFSLTPLIPAQAGISLNLRRAHAMRFSSEIMRVPRLRGDERSDTMDIRDERREVGC